MKQILKKYDAQPQVCPDDSGKPLGFGACFTAFLVLISGAGVALIIFCIEMIGLAFGLNIPFLTMYGVGDMPQFDESNFMKILMIKDNEIMSLKNQLTRLSGKSKEFFKTSNWN